MFAALVEYIAINDQAPAVRDLCVAVGWLGEKEVWWALQRLESVGVIRWPMDETGKRMPRGIELNVPLRKPVVVPVVGYLNEPADFVPGERWVEFHDNGRIIVRGKDDSWDGEIVHSERSVAIEREKGQEEVAVLVEAEGS